MARRKTSSSPKAHTEAPNKRSPRDPGINSPGTIQGDVLQATYAAIYLAQRARVLTKPDRREPLLTCIGNLTITLRTSWNPAPIHVEKQHFAIPPYSVTVWERAEHVLDIRWDDDDRYVVVRFEPGPWQSELIEAATGGTSASRNASNLDQGGGDHA